MTSATPNLVPATAVVIEVSDRSLPWRMRISGVRRRLGASTSRERHPRATALPIIGQVPFSLGRGRRRTSA